MWLLSRFLLFALDCPFFDPSVKVHSRWYFPRNYVFAYLPFNTIVVTSTYMDVSLQSGGVFCAFWPPKVYVRCSSPICSSVLIAGLFALRYLFLNYPFIKGSSIEPQTTQMSCSQDICSSLLLSSRDTLDSLG